MEASVTHVQMEPLLGQKVNVVVMNVVQVRNPYQIETDVDSVLLDNSLLVMVNARIVQLVILRLMKVLSFVFLVLVEWNRTL